MKGAIQITGRVQGVWFRAFTREQAQMLELDGWVKNLMDGSVYCEVQGDPQTVERFLDTLRKGPANSRVESVTIQWTETDENFSGFEIRY